MVGFNEAPNRVSKRAQVQLLKSVSEIRSIFALLGKPPQFPSLFPDQGFQESPEFPTLLLGFRLYSVSTRARSAARPQSFEPVDPGQTAGVTSPFLADEFAPGELKKGQKVDSRTNEFVKYATGQLGLRQSMLGKPKGHSPNVSE